MFIPIKTKDDIQKMRRVSRLAANMLEYLTPFVKKGTNTEEINRLSIEYAKKHNAIAAPQNYKGYPKSICTSINNVVSHGIPKESDILKKGDIVNIDVTLIKDGFHGDTSKTIIIDNTKESTKLLVDRVKNALKLGISAVKPGGKFNDIGVLIDKYISQFGYSIVRALGGHGIGKKFHEPPFVYHYPQNGRSPKFKAGMCFTIEPMINEGGYEVVTDPFDGWTVTTKDGSLSAQFEHTILVTPDGVEILTIPG
jgi:methionyl aminopeptidase